MYQRTERLTVATGDAAGLVTRIQSDLAPLTQSASGFISYTIVTIDAATVLSTRLFTDQGAIDAATASTHDTTTAIATDFGLSLEVVADADVSVGAAAVMTVEFRP